MLALASFLQSLQNDPGAIGKRFEISADAADRATDVEALPGVARPRPRYALDGLDSFQLGETLNVVAYPGDHTEFEAPPLAEGPAAADGRRGRGRAGTRRRARARGRRHAGRPAPLRRARPASRSSGSCGAIDNEGRVAFVKPTPPARGRPRRRADHRGAARRRRRSRRRRGGAARDRRRAAGGDRRHDARSGVPRRARERAAGRRRRQRADLPVHPRPGARRDGGGATAGARRPARRRRRPASDHDGPCRGGAPRSLLVAIPLGIVLERWSSACSSNLAAGYADARAGDPGARRSAVARRPAPARALLAASRVASRSERASIPIELRGG